MKERNKLINKYLKLETKQYTYINDGSIQGLFVTVTNLKSCINNEKLYREQKCNIFFLF